MTEADVDAVSAIRVRGWQSAYAGIIPETYLNEMTIAADANRRRAWFTSSRGQVMDVVAVDAHESAVGWVSFGPYRGETDAPNPGEVYALYVDPKSIGQGIGRALLNAAHNHTVSQGFSTMQLWVLRDNLRARVFYAAADYAPDGAVQTDMYGETEVTELRYRRQMSR
ncbi:GNAT family N-acetyltransferase [Sphaerisporangium sp. NPDC051017]|uniref:GNAT family N-acetyltransferase n=1 Tax=Sphaerisporangium sp. NPDC051017 TaxID=3154636 RepID=UPI00343B66D3